MNRAWEAHGSRSGERRSSYSFRRFRDRGILPRTTHPSDQSAPGVETVALTLRVLVESVMDPVAVRRSETILHYLEIVLTCPGLLGHRALTVGHKQNKVSGGLGELACKTVVGAMSTQIPGSVRGFGDMFARRLISG